MAEYNPQQHLEDLQAMLNEVESELDDRHLLPEDRRKFQNIRKSVKAEIKQVKAELKALTAEKVTTRQEYDAAVVAHQTLQHTIPEVPQGWDEDVLPAIAEHKKRVADALDARYTLLKRLAAQGQAPGQHPRHDAVPPDDFWLGELCLHGAAHGYTIAEVCEKVNGINEGFTWAAYDTIHKLLAKNSRGKSLTPEQMGLVEEVVSDMFADEIADAEVVSEGGGLFADEGEEVAPPPMSEDQLLILSQCQAALGFVPKGMVESEEDADQILEGYCSILDKIDRRKKAFESWLAEYTQYQKLIEEHYLPLVEAWTQDNCDPGKKSKKFASCMVQFTSYKDSYNIKDKAKLLGELLKKAPEELAELGARVETRTVAEYDDINILKKHAISTGDTFNGALKLIPAHTEMKVKR